MKEVMELCREAEKRDSKLQNVKNNEKEKSDQGNVSELKFEFNHLSMESEMKEEVKNEIIVKEEFEFYEPCI